MTPSSFKGSSAKAETLYFLVAEQTSEFHIASIALPSTSLNASNLYVAGDNANAVCSNGLFDCYTAHESGLPTADIVAVQP